MNFRLLDVLCRGIIVAVVGTSLTFAADAADPKPFGPVPILKVDAKKAALGKRLFFDPRLSGAQSP